MYKIKSNIFFFVTEYPVAHPSIITLWKQNGSGANCRTESMNLCFMISRHHDRSSMKIWIIYKHTKAFFMSQKPCRLSWYSNYDHFKL